LAPALKVLIASVVTACAVALAVAAFAFPAAPNQLTAGDAAFWVLVTILSSAAPVRLPGGLRVAVSTTPILAATFLYGPAAGGLIALVGSTEVRELRGRIPWYGTAYNHAAIALPAIVAGMAFHAILPLAASAGSLGSLVAAISAGGLNFVINGALSSTAIALREDRAVGAIFRGDLRVVGTSLVALAPLAWVMGHVYISVGFWGALVFGLPLYTTRSAYEKVVEIREMFTQTVKALASAIDARDPKTKQHSQHVSSIAVDIGRAMRCSEAELEQLEWGGLLHDIGKIGIADSVLLKPDRLNREERIAMNAHPVKGEEILRPVERLAPELPLIRHHHEWYNGSGYPDRLVGEAIPFLARILHVADAYEAMTAIRPYRLTPLSHQQAMAELTKYSGIQFDPKVVEAFGRTEWASGTKRAIALPEPEAQIPVLGQVAALRARGAISPAAVPSADGS
jgi:riboflavin transporter FmnP